MKDFAGRAAFVTGGANGIGIGLVRALLKQGCNVAIADIRSESIEAALKSLRDPRVMGVQVDDHGLSQVGDTRRHLLHQETQALLVPAGIVRVGGDRQQRAEAAALFVELVDLLHALRRVADDP